MNFQSTKTYTVFTGTILFLFGFLGLAFPSYFNVSSSYFILSLILGFWGLVIGLGNRKN